MKILVRFIIINLDVLDLVYVPVFTYSEICQFMIA